MATFLDICRPASKKLSMRIILSVLFCSGLSCDAAMFRSFLCPARAPPPSNGMVIDIVAGRDTSCLSGSMEEVDYENADLSREISFSAKLAFDEVVSFMENNDFFRLDNLRLNSETTTATITAVVNKGLDEERLVEAFRKKPMLVHFLPDLYLFQEDHRYLMLEALGAAQSLDGSSWKQMLSKIMKGPLGSEFVDECIRIKKKTAEESAEGVSEAQKRVLTELSKDLDFLLEAIKLDGKAFFIASKECRKDSEIIQAVLSSSVGGEQLEFLDDDAKNKFNAEVLELVREEGKLLEHVSRSQKEDEEFVVAAVETDYRNLKYASAVSTESLKKAYENALGGSYTWKQDLAFVKFMKETSDEKTGWNWVNGAARYHYVFTNSGGFFFNKRMAGFGTTGGFYNPERTIRQSLLATIEPMSQSAGTEAGPDQESLTLHQSVSFLSESTEDDTLDQDDIDNGDDGDDNEDDDINSPNDGTVPDETDTVDAGAGVGRNSSKQEPLTSLEDDNGDNEKNQAFKNSLRA